ncbi:efflux RND transporter periplasmic adaptor subunit [Melittangium boletus]|uniref:Cobalt/zinc/cadmium efflux RND transporter membrane fusion protein, CzcB family n=1 Tax=Melittangium boletus DSM 14713 TaxID=1294270 RepID=A0A250I804_9BACT|nr:efflux RND transporter periplasmic adaptor subunit [Melittangium boletus]ATB27292.1 cobalt/zinc/cadmium efflux RND transporter membrane fusion protein, CzcB family [Melittangium boletus DSM 14713]
MSTRGGRWLVLAVLGLAQGCTKEDEHGAREAHAEARPDDEGGHDERLVRLAPEAVRSAALKTEEARRKPLSVGLTAPARVSFSQRGVAQVAARVPGRLASIEVNLGQRVKKGQVLGYLESPELGRARADYLSAATKARVAEDNHRREKELFAKGITSEREMREAESTFVTAQAERNAADGRLHALGLSDAEIAALRGNEHYSSRLSAISPLDGTVVDITGMVGQAVEATTTLFTVGDLSELWVLLDVAEVQVAAVKNGQAVDITLSALPGRRFQGHVAYIGDIVNEKTRTVHVRVVVSNQDGALKPGMFAQAEIATGTGTEETNTPRLVVPREAVQQVNGEQVVFVPEQPGVYRAVDVRTGASSAKEVEIVSGIEPGTLVITQGAFILKSELSRESLGAGHSH